jgi:hypothetical protein
VTDTPQPVEDQKLEPRSATEEVDHPRDDTEPINLSPSLVMEAVKFAGGTNGSVNGGVAVPGAPTTSGQAPIVHSTNYELLDRDDRPFAIYGRQLGFGTSHRDDHSHTVDTGTYASRGNRCSGCRWFEVRIFSVEGEYGADDADNACTCQVGTLITEDVDIEVHEDNCGVEAPRARYLVLTYGRSVVPGETTKRRAMWTDSAFEVIEVLTQRNDTGAFLPVTSARALANAATWDEDIKEAYINRAVV